MAHFSKLVLAMVVLGLCACTSYPPAPSSFPPAGKSYILQANDTIQLRVYDEPEFSGRFKVDSLGDVALPLAGKIRLRGATEQQAATIIETALKDKGYLQNPKISVELARARPYFILGEVTKPGQFPFQSGLTVYQAVAASGGLTYRADRDDITIRRQNPASGAGHEIRLSATEDTPILPGDVLEIGERYF